MSTIRSDSEAENQQCQSIASFNPLALCKRIGFVTAKDPALMFATARADVASALPSRMFETRGLISHHFRCHDLSNQHRLALMPESKKGLTTECPGGPVCMQSPEKSSKLLRDR